jgi:aryl-alcohol dehydrogenase-like predicted oxidoreductase
MSTARLGFCPGRIYYWDPATPVEETLRALDDLVRQGLVRAVGLSNWAAWQVSRALGVSERLNLARFQTYQGYYSLVGRDIEREVLPMLEAEGLGLIVFSPLAGGYLTGKYRDGGTDGRRATIQFPPVDEGRGEGVLDAMDKIAAAHSVSMEAVAIAWLRQQRVVTSVITGVKNVDQLEANLKAVDVKLSDTELKALGEVGAPAPEYPGWMIAQGSAGRAALLAMGEVPAGH